MTDRLLGSSRPVTTATHRDTFGLVVFLLLVAIVLQKVALPGTGNALPISTALLPATALFGWSFGYLRLDFGRLCLLALFLAVALLSVLINSGTEQISMLSLCLILVVHAPLALRPEPNDACYVRSVCFFRDLMFLLGLGGILQFLVQFVIGAQFAYFIDFYLPKDYYLQFYNALNPLYYGSIYLKSNGIFFSEPSVFSQFVALAAIAEFVTRRRWIRLVGFAAALFVSFSGTGLMTLGAFAITWTITSRRPGYLLLAMAAVAAVFLLGGALDLGYITGRLAEFTTPNSSGHARFISIFYLLDTITFNDMVSAFLGTGPGTLPGYYALAPFAMFDPTWGKALFEYGLCGFALYLALLMQSVRTTNVLLSVPLLLTVLLAGGYLTNAYIMTLIVVLAAWHSDEAAAGSA